MKSLAPFRLLCLALALTPALWSGMAQAQSATELERPAALDPAVLNPRPAPLERQIPTRLQLPGPTDSSIPPDTPPTSQPASTPALDADGNPLSADRNSAPAAAPAAPATPTAAPLSRGGSLLGQSGTPSAPTVGGRQRETVQPLRQVLLSAADMAEAEAQRRKLAGVGVRIVSRKRLPGLGVVLSVFAVPDSLAPETFAEQLRGEFPNAAAEANQRYRLMGQPTQTDVKYYGQHMVGLKVPSSCNAPVRLAMLDSGVNTLIPPLQGRAIQVTNVTGATSLPQTHGTAIATLLLSSDAAFPGLLPRASLEAVAVFATDSNDEPETRTDWILQGLDHLAGLESAPQVVNMSFGGSYSAFIKSAIDVLAPRMLFIAAAGNAGTDDKVYPAAYDKVIAVGAVDARQRRSRHSNFGKHVQLYAPGEDIWVSDADNRGFFASGSSYAAPFATAALALLRQSGIDPDHYLASLGANRLVDFRTLCKP